MLIQLGDFQFSIPTLTYNEIERISTFKFASHSVLGANDRLLAVGPDNETLRITGTYISDLKSQFINRTFATGSDPLFSAINSGIFSGNPFEEIRLMATEQKPLHLQSEDGKNHGYWVIYDLNTRSSKFVQQGALKVSYTIQLKYYGRRVR